MVLESLHAGDIVTLHAGVLILLWVEYGLGGAKLRTDYLYVLVLILLWVEYGLGVEMLSA